VPGWHDWPYLESVSDVKFQWDFALDGKSVEVQEADNGDLYIEGYASDYLPDRDGEIVTPDALRKALDAYMANPVLMYNHKLSEQMGRVAKAIVDDKGLRIGAIVRRPEPGTERMNRYMDVKRGDLRGFSIGGFFKRVKDALGRMNIPSLDLVEISLTPTPVNPRTLGTVAGKALSEADDWFLPFQLMEVSSRLETLAVGLELDEARSRLYSLLET
jgi:HK97 family phage prohead protease